MKMIKIGVGNLANVQFSGRHWRAACATYILVSILLEYRSIIIWYVDDFILNYILDLVTSHGSNCTEQATNDSLLQPRP